MYDTYGFPLDLTKEILTENNLKVDTKEFDKHMENQRNLARNARKSDAGWSLESVNIDEFKETEFLGYDNFETNANIIALYDNKEKVNFIKNGHKGIIISDKTSFYAEGGGEVADTGYIISDNAKAKVYDVQKKKDVLIDYVEIVEGELTTGCLLYTSDAADDLLTV